MISDEQWRSLERRLARSKFRSQFKLGEDEIAYVNDRGLDLVRRHAGDFIRQRLMPAEPRNDGRQTPTKGHPVFIAQHATGTCCRSCLGKWHKLPKGKALSERQAAVVVEVIMRWIATQVAAPPAA